MERYGRQNDIINTSLVKPSNSIFTAKLSTEDMPFTDYGSVSRTEDEHTAYLHSSQLHSKGSSTGPSGSLAQETAPAHSLVDRDLPGPSNTGGLQDWLTTESASCMADKPIESFFHFLPLQQQHDSTTMASCSTELDTSTATELLNTVNVQNEEAAKSVAKSIRKRNKKAEHQSNRHHVIHDYHDNYHDPENFEGSKELALEGRVFRGGVSVHFPEVLHKMLKKVDDLHLSHIVSWQPHGRSFRVHWPEKYVETVMPR